MNETTERRSLARLLLALKTAAAAYRAEAAECAPSPEGELLEVLGRRCARFETELAAVLYAPAAGRFANGDAAAAEKPKPREHVFARIEDRENRLERLYREALHERAMPAETRRLLEAQSRVVRRWHNFVIDEEINFLFGRKMKIPAELNER